MIALVDRGFNVQDLFLAHHVTVATHPLQKEKHILQKCRLNRLKQFQGHAFM